MVLIRTPAGQRIFVNWNVQAFANECSRVTGATNFGTYLGHQPTAERATDVFTTIPMPRANRVLGDAIAEFALRPDIWKRFGLRYIIWRQRINYNDGNGWRFMENRGNDTQNHFDHDHISFNVIPAPTGTITPSGGTDVIIVNVQDTGIFLLRGDQVHHFSHPDHVLAFVRAGVPYQDKVSMPSAVFRAYTGWGAVRQGARAADAGEEVMPYDEMLGAVKQEIEAAYDEYVQSLQV